MNSSTITIGARGSALSVIQAEGVIKALQYKFPRHTFCLKKITTLGDRTSQWQQADVGIFVKELEEALLRKEIDIAVHSLKDMPSALSSGLTLAAVPAREDPRDCVILKEKTTLKKLKRNACIGTGSLRRSSQLLCVRPDVRIKPIRGNVDTRIKKLLSGEYDAIVVALAGLKRLGYSVTRKENIFIWPLSFSLMLPACGQGALGIEIRSNDTRILPMVREINDEKSFLCVSAERAFLREFGAGCRIPVGALARIKNNELHLEGMVASLDGKKIIRRKTTAALTYAEGLGKSLARKILKKADKEILKEIKAA